MRNIDAESGFSIRFAVGQIRSDSSVDDADVMAGNLTGLLNKIKPAVDGTIPDLRDRGRGIVLRRRGNASNLRNLWAFLDRMAT